MKSLFALALFCVIPSLGNAVPIVSVDAVPGGGVDGSATVTQGDSFTVDVVIDSVTDLGGFDIQLGYDPTIFSTMTSSVVSGDFFGVFGSVLTNTVDQSLGVIQFAELSLGLSGTTGSGVLFSATFDVIGSGVSDLSLPLVMLTDSLAGDIPPTDVESASITAEPSQNPVPGVLPLLALGLLGLGGSRLSSRR
jgi:hypothetical protein